jgi:RNA recognition motif-containing protein
MEGFELTSISKSIHHGLRILLKNSFIHTEAISEGQAGTSASKRSRSAPPYVAYSESTTKLTTLMMRNIPTKLTQVTLLSVLSKSFDMSAVDFFYLPIDFKSGKNLGYAFINFESNVSYSEFVDRFSGFRLSSQSSKILSLTPAKIQGLDKNYNLFKTSSVMIYAPPEYRPMTKCSKCAVLCPLSGDHAVLCEKC